MVVCKYRVQGLRSTLQSDIPKTVQGVDDCLVFQWADEVKLAKLANLNSNNNKYIVLFFYAFSIPEKGGSLPLERLAQWELLCPYHLAPAPTDGPEV